MPWHYVRPSFQQLYMYVIEYAGRYTDKQVPFLCMYQEELPSAQGGGTPYTFVWG